MERAQGKSPEKESLAKQQEAKRTDGGGEPLPLPKGILAHYGLQPIVVPLRFGAETHHLVSNPDDAELAMHSVPKWLRAVLKTLRLDCCLGPETEPLLEDVRQRVDRLNVVHQRRRERREEQSSEVEDLRERLAEVAFDIGGLEQPRPKQRPTGQDNPVYAESRTINAGTTVRQHPRLDAEPRTLRAKARINLLEMRRTEEGTWYKIQRDRVGTVSDRADRGWVEEQDLSVSDEHEELDVTFARGELEPTADDIVQGGINDCFLLAALMTVVRQGGDDSVFDMLRDEGKTVSVRFYRPAGGNAFSEEWVSVEKSLRRDQKSAGSEWVGIVEKAYAKWNGRGSYGGIEGGSPVDALQHLIGQRAERTDLKEVMEDAGRVIEERLQKDPRAVVMTKAFGKMKPHPQLTQSHAYELVALGRDRSSVLLRNPHGKAKEQIEATFELKLDFFLKCFETLDSVTGPVENGSESESDEGRRALNRPKEFASTTNSATLRTYFAMSWSELEEILDKHPDETQAKDELERLRSLYKDRQEHSTAADDLLRVEALINRLEKLD